MGSNKLVNGEKPPAFTSMLQENDFAFPNWHNAAAADNTGILLKSSGAKADPMSFPHMPFQVTPFPWKHMHGTCQPGAPNIPETCSNSMVDLNQLQNLQNPNHISNGNNITCLYGRDSQYPDWNMKGVSYTCDKTGTADIVMNDSAHFNSFQNPGIKRKLLPIRGNICGGYEMTTQGGEADMSSIYTPQIQNFVGSGGSRTFNTQKSEEIGIQSNGGFYAARLGCPRKIDGSFLSLGIGSNTDAKSKSDQSSREINGGELYGAVSPQLTTSRIRKATGTSLNFDHSIVGGVSSWRNNVGEFTSLGNHAGGWSPSYDDVGVGGCINASPNSSQFHILQKPQADVQHGFPTYDTRQLGIVCDRDARYANLNAYKGLRGELAASAGPYSNRSTGLLDSGQIGASGSASESVKLSWTARPTSDQLHNCLTESVQNFPPESSVVSSFVRFKGSSTRQEHSGQLFPASKDSSAQAVDGRSQLPTWKRVQPAGQLTSANDVTSPYGTGGGLFPKRTGFQAIKDGEAQAAGSGLFPRRLGVHANEHRAAQAARDGLFHRNTGIQDLPSHVAYAAECGQYTTELGVQMETKGRPQLFGADLRGTSLTTGCSQEGLHVQYSKDRVRSALATGQPISTAKGSGLSQVSNVLGVPLPSLKRSAIRPPPAAPQVLRRKITLPPPIHPYMPSPQTAPAALIPVSAPPPHIIWNGSDGLPQPIGQKCLLCKRDLSFTPEGPVRHPPVPPAVAVLPCGHTFHDHCLQAITPEDQSKDPPCIPCAIGEI